MFLQESLTGQSDGGLTKLLMERPIKVLGQAYKLLLRKVWDNYPKVYGQKKVGLPKFSSVWFSHLWARTLNQTRT